LGFHAFDFAVILRPARLFAPPRSDSPRTTRTYVTGLLPIILPSRTSPVKATLSHRTGAIIEIRPLKPLTQLEEDVAYAEANDGAEHEP
jgi:hypothetical protein